MDDAMIARLLSTYDGAQPTVKNVNAARQFFATNPEIAEKRAMGLRGSGVDDNSDIFGAQLEKFMQSAEAEPPAGRVEVGQPEVVAPPTQQAAPRQAAKAPTMGPNLPMASGAVNPLDGPAAPGTSTKRGGFGLEDILLAFLGLSSTAGRSGMNGSGLEPPAQGQKALPAPEKQKALPRAIGEDGKLLENPYPDGQKRLTYEPKLEEGGANARAAEADRTKTITNDPVLNEQGKKAQLQAEIDAENTNQKLEMEAEQRIKTQEAKRLQDQIATKKLSDAAKRTLLRR